MGVRVHVTRLMRPGEFALWRGGAIVSSGLLGSHLEPMTFEVITLHAEDGDRLRERLGDIVGCAKVLRTIAEWWEAP